MAEKKGRKSAYETRIKPFFPQIMEMCKTMTDAQMAESLGVDKSTWFKYKKEKAEFSDILKKGRQNLVAELKSSLIKKANGYDYTEKKTVTESLKFTDDIYKEMIADGYTAEQLRHAKLIKTEVAHKHASPDVAAINLALKNYDREGWANDPQMLAIRKEELKLREKQVEQNAW